MKHNRFERGQSLVLIVLAVVGMLGFAALAVDGGRLLAERRRAQSAADSAALAAAFSKTPEQNGNITQWATDSLSGNGFVHDPGVVDIEIHNPPNSGPYQAAGTCPHVDSDPSTASAEACNYYQVKIRAVVDKVFSQFIFPGTLVYQVEAVSHLNPSHGIAPGIGLAASGEDTCRGIRWNGTIVTNVQQGSIFSNSEGLGGSSCYSGITDGRATKADGVTLEDPAKIYAPDGTISMAGEFINKGNAIIYPAVEENADNKIFDTFPMPSCTTPAASSYKSGSIYHLPPGLHTSEFKPNGSQPDWVLDTGIHCFTKGFSFSQNSLIGTGVFIAMLDGDLSITGGTTVELTPIFTNEESTDDGGNSWPGMLIYMPPENDGGIDISGNSGSTYTGTIYAPGERDPASKEKCNFVGTTGTMSLNSSIICHTIGISGSATINIVYNESSNIRTRTKMDLTQ